MPIHFVDKIKLIWYPQVRNSITHLTLVNKFLKAFQIAHARQDTIEHRNVDVMHRMVARSDPWIHANLDTNTIRAGLLYWVSKKKYMASYLFSKYETFEGSEWN